MLRTIVLFITIIIIDKNKPSLKNKLFIDTYIFHNYKYSIKCSNTSYNNSFY